MTLILDRKKKIFFAALVAAFSLTVAVTGFSFNLSGYPVLNLSATIDCGANMSCSQAGTILSIDGAQIAHGNLSSIGTNTHIQLDNFITNNGKKSVSANIRNSHDAEISTNSASPTKLKTITFTNGLLGSVRILFDMKSSASVAPGVFGQIYKNGVAIGTLRQRTTNSYNTYSEDFSNIDLESGDTLEIWGYGSGGRTCYIQNFRIAYDNDATVAVSSSNS